MKIAIGYHGLIRGFRFDDVRESHKTLLIEALRAQGYTVDIFVHTFDKEFDKSIYEVNPVRIEIEKDKEVEAYVKKYMKPYIFPHYFKKEHHINYFKDMYTRKKCYELIENPESYTWILMMNPGQLITAAIDDLRYLNAEELYLPDFSHTAAYNGRCAIGSPKAMKIYSSMFDWLLANQNPPLYLSNPSQDIFDALGRVNLHPESSIKHLLNKHGFFPREKGFLLKRFAFERVRTDGTRKPNDV